MASIAILGGGFGGLTVAREVRRRLPRDHTITLVSDRPEFVFRPSLVWVALGLRRPEQVTVPLSDLLKRWGVSFHHGVVERVDLSRQRVYASGAVHAYDFLVIAVGADLEWDGVPGAKEHAQTVMTLEGALRAREAMEQFQGGEVVVGTAPGTPCVGPAYEAAFNMHFYLVRRGLRRRSRITFLTYEDELLDIAGRAAAEKVKHRFNALGIHWRRGVQLSRVSPEGVELLGGERLPANLTLLVPSYRPRLLGGGLQGAAADPEGFLRTDGAMRLLGYDNVYVVGDAVSLAAQKSGHLAMIQGKVTGANLAAAIERREPVAWFKPDLLCILDMGGHKAMLVKRAPNSPGFVLPGRWARALKAAFEWFYLMGLRRFF